VKQRAYQNQLLKLGNGNMKVPAVLSPLKCSSIQMANAGLAVKLVSAQLKQSAQLALLLPRVEHMRSQYKNRTEYGADLPKKSA
jgi:hypothetical protein